jgi:hypothetical protein
MRTPRQAVAGEIGHEDPEISREQRGDPPPGAV